MCSTVARKRSKLPNNNNELDADETATNSTSAIDSDSTSDDNGGTTADGNRTAVIVHFGNVLFELSSFSN